jgi:chromosome partitioning protein
MREAAQDIPILPAIPESEQYKKALDSGVTLAELGYPHLELPFLKVVELLKEKCRIQMPSVG